MRVRTLPVPLALSLALSLGVTAALAPAAAGKQISSAKLKALSNSLNNARHMTYVATYTSVSDGQTSNVTIAQAPHKSLFKTSSGSVVNTGSKTYYCSTSGSSDTSGTSGSGNSGNSGNSGAGSGNSGNSGSKGSVQCLSAGGGANPLLGLEQAFNPTAALNAFSQARQGAIARALGIKLSSSSATIGGQPSTCVTISVRGKNGKYCVTNKGVLSYVGDSSTSYFKLASFSSKPAASLFTLPAGATTATLPSTPSVP